MSRFLSLGALLLVGCMPIVIDHEPAPTRLEPSARNQVEVVWENHSDRMYVVSITGRTDEQQAFAQVEPCSAHNVIQFADPPFEVGLREAERFAPEPGPTLVRSSELAPPPDGLYRILIRIDADGTASREVLAGREPWQPRSLGDC